MEAGLNAANSSRSGRSARVFFIQDLIWIFQTQKFKEYSSHIDNVFQTISKWLQTFSCEIMAFAPNFSLQFHFGFQKMACIEVRDILQSHGRYLRQFFFGKKSLARRDEHVGKTDAVSTFIAVHQFFFGKN